MNQAILDARKWLSRTYLDARKWNHIQYFWMVHCLGLKGVSSFEWTFEILNLWQTPEKRSALEEKVQQVGPQVEVEVEVNLLKIWMLTLR
jgi:hypothetical protein